MSHDTFTDHDRINWLESQLATLRADHARLVEHTDYLLKDRNEWQAAYRAEQERHDETIQRLQAALTERTRLVEENRRLYQIIEQWQSFEATQAELLNEELDGEPS